MTRHPRAVLMLLLAALMVPAIPASAQQIRWRGSVDLGRRSVAAADTFETVVGSAAGTTLGAGAEVLLPHDLFVRLRLSRYHATGERVFLFDGQRYGLGIPLAVSIVPVDLSAGYRWRPRWRIVPYAGGGVGWHRYAETSDFAAAGEDVRRWHAGYHLLGGAERRVSRWVAAAAELQWESVPGALGDDANGVAAAFGESNLGGAAFRVRVVVGR